MGKTYCVISHTHWDREWNLPFENFRIRLVDMIDNLMDVLDQDKDFRFHLDAQTIVLEDYLEIKPENRDKLKKYISEGRILVGPWYVQNDLFLTSGEATIRNLLIGYGIAEEFGRCTMIGYTPDQFGNISQLPQIYNKFGIDTCIFGRGYTFEQPEKSEFYWRSEDGSKVLAVYLTFWYNNAQRFPSDIDKAMKMLEHIKVNLDTVSTTEYYLLMNGVDNLEAQENLLSILEEINKRLPEGERIIQYTMPEYMDRIKLSAGNLINYTGEMRFGKHFNILAGTLSSRVYLKQWNTRCQVLMEKRLEPIYSFIQMTGAEEYPAAFMKYLWKLLIQNHPHDDICGCSVDSVHEHMMDRFKRVGEVGQELLIRGMEFIASYINRDNLYENQYLIIVFNTNRNKRNGVVEVDIDFLAEEGIESFGITDENGKEVPFQIINKRNKTKGTLTPINLPGVLDITSYRTRVWIDSINGLSYRNFIVTSGEIMSVTPEQSEEDSDALENEHLKVEILSNGTINLYDKASGIWYNNLLALEDREDTGDSYVYRNNPACSAILSSDSTAVITKIESNDLNMTYSISYSLYLPKEYNCDRNMRSEELEDVSVEIRLSLNKGSRQLNVSIKVDNKVKDHRMRILFPTGICTDISAAGSPFDVVLRDKKLIKKGILEVEQQPNVNFINVDGDGYGIAVFNEGLYEYENLFDDKNTIALTLLRGNGSIAGAGTGIPVEESWMVPGNQCLGVYTMKLAVYPYKGDFIKAQVVQKVQDFLNPLFSYYQPVNTKKFIGGRAFVQDSELNELFFRDKKYPGLKLPLQTQFLAIDGDDIVLSCIKKKEKGESIILRFYNIASEKRNFSLTFFKQIKEAYVTNMREERLIPLMVKGRAIADISADPKEIVTIEIVL